jgi:DNA primase
MEISTNFIERLKGQINISDLVSKRVKLTKKGKDYFGRCPFHGEKTPSFSVNDTKQFYHCFGCGANGDIINFVEQTENLDFGEAVKHLAKSYNIPVPENAKPVSKAEFTIDKINVEAAKWFHRNLRSQEAIQSVNYLHNREISNEYIKSFFLGYAPNTKNSLISYLKSRGYSESDLRKSGLITILDNGQIIDKFRGRVMFPIVNFKGKIIAFGGRAIEKDAQPKYLNSPETEVFHKKQVLYNENTLFKELRSAKQVYIVEGYTDVISLYMAGIKNVVATLGTSVSEFHIKKLWKMSEAPTVCMDGDSAGMKAMARVIDVVLPILKPGYSVNFIKMPEGLDPDDVVKNHGVSYLKNLFEHKIDLCEAIWNLYISTADLKTPEKQAMLKKRFQDSSDRIEDVNVRKFYNQYFNNKLFEFFRGRNSIKSRKLTASKSKVESLSQLERAALNLLALIMETPSLMINDKVHDEFFAITLDSEYFHKIYSAISFVYSEISRNEKIDDFDSRFKSLLNDKLDFSIIKHLSGAHTHFLDKISVKDINNMLMSWDQTFACYSLEVLKDEYRKSVQSLDEGSMEIAANLKKQIIETESWISSLSE